MDALQVHTYTGVKTQLRELKKRRAISPVTKLFNLAGILLVSIN